MRGAPNGKEATLSALECRCDGKFAKRWRLGKTADKRAPKKLVTGFGAIVSIQTEKLRTFLFNFNIVVPFEKMDDECFLLWSVMEGELFESNMIFCVGLVLCPLTKGSEHGEVPVDFWWWCVTGGCSVVKWVGGTSNGDDRMERFLGEGWSRFVAERRQLLVKQLVEGQSHGTFCERLKNCGREYTLCDSDHIAPCSV